MSFLERHGEAGLEFNNTTLSDVYGYIKKPVAVHVIVLYPQNTKAIIQGAVFRHLLFQPASSLNIIFVLSTVSLNPLWLSACHSSVFFLHMRFNNSIEILIEYFKARNVTGTKMAKGQTIVSPRKLIPSTSIDASLAWQAFVSPSRYFSPRIPSKLVMGSFTLP
ncbi:MAG: hypothetical protein MI799_15500 [Desulfobacterales bacterium]|nr:hypothetical protein [Desulfobacterales bacterium]